MNRMGLKIAVLCDGAGLARLGLERAGHKCTGFELDPWKHYLSQMVGSGNCIMGDITKVDLSKFDAVWASPPCQLLSRAKNPGTTPVSQFAVNLLPFCLNLPHNILWVENVAQWKKSDNDWGTTYNAAQFGPKAIQNRNRVIGGRYEAPHVQRDYKRVFKGVCPAILASEYKGYAKDPRRASRFYGRRLELEECAYHQGFTVPEEWLEIPDEWTGRPSEWKYNLYEAVGNGVPVYMAEAFGRAY